jgi:Phage terminase, small subunit
MAWDGLTAKQKRFVELFEGNATQAALSAGYSKKTAAAIGKENLRKPLIVAAIRARENKTIRPLIADRETRQKFWTDTMLDSEQEMKDRLKASELLGKSEGDFLDRIEHSGGLDLASAIEEGRRRVAGS